MSDQCLDPSGPCPNGKCAHRLFSHVNGWCCVNGCSCDVTPKPPATPQKDGELPARLMDLVRHQRHELHEEGLISDEEFAALVADSDGGKRVARLESYDEVKAQLLEARARLAASDNQVERLTEGIQALMDELRLYDEVRADWVCDELEKVRSTAVPEHQS